MEQENIDYNFIPSLKHRALVKIAVALWNKTDYRDLIESSSAFYYYIFLKQWRLAEDKVIRKVSDLPLPEPLKKEVLCIMQPIGLEIKKWKEYHEFHCGLFFTSDLSAELCWTPQGTVDQKKTAEAFVQDEALDITTRYRLACIYCLEDHIRQLWNSVPYRKKKKFCEVLWETRQIVLWTYEITGQFTKSRDLIQRIVGREISPYQCQFEYLIEYGNKAATEYFLQKLTIRERNECLVKCAKSVAEKHYLLNFQNCVINEVNHTDILCFLLSQMNEEQQSKVFEGCPAGVLSCFLVWPWQHIFMEAANRVWDFLPKEQYASLLKVIVKKARNDFKDCNYSQLFGRFWKESPSSHKKHVIGLNSSDLIEDLLKIGDEENVRLIFKSATVKEREEMILLDEGKDFCKSLIFNNK